MRTNEVLWKSFIIFNNSENEIIFYDLRRNVSVRIIYGIWLKNHGEAEPAELARVLFTDCDKKEFNFRFYSV